MKRFGAPSVLDRRKSPSKIPLQCKQLHNESPPLKPSRQLPVEYLQPDNSRAYVAYLPPVEGSMDSRQTTRTYDVA
ncbi:hypothetical protein NDU88_005986 [Pleurodeles waltl]|uniref:Uncharacterized protein n=1 Tax=Pleurodeles waltl TaxID=8319 RepID=A0AAV7WEY1_PLEWA|nr:hypothetical protein NDU88_005986 [Pleurodeles waltl]